MSLGVLAVLGLVGGLDVESMPVWRAAAYLLLGVLAYLHGRRVEERYAWRILGGVAVLGGGGVVVRVSFPEGFSTLLLLGVVVVLPWLAGRYRRQQALLVETERERVRQLEREQEHVAERARLAERGRVAADLHDSLGHELALIALRAGAMELSPDLRVTHQRTAGELRALAVSATDRLRQTIAMLRDRDDAPPVADTVERARAAGMTVHVEEFAPLPDLVDQAVRRVVREALTNAARHAPGAPVTITLAVRDRVARLIVSNTADGPPGLAGSGLVGLRERLRLLGGRLDTTLGDGRFDLTAEVPLT
ncbi:sensor histidine kinase [Actinophytocola algeriensis]|uniref:histidine kinase n=1 Tax=Actinophytocola algeriensis TaxID=1768010 RepID=A0A7W7VJ23_9PSEU|nr:histidine kinase [Actinophytocola algeriensis]MBB4911894.1 signal transduction histidine kinase [Actinophytocola algeriensis]MBE1477614.1 signal transduction histidine kinase [Actinophytocola algeriensis]